MSGRTYQQHFAGDTVRPVHNGYRMRCCDCGLVHRITFRIYTDARGAPSVKFTIWGDKHATAASRVAMKRKHQGVFA